MNYRDMGFDLYFRRTIPPNPNQQSAVSYDAQQEGDQVIEYGIQDGAVTNRKIKSFRAEKIESSTLRALVDFGLGATGGLVELDGPNNRIVLSKNNIPSIIIQG